MHWEVVLLKNTLPGLQELQIQLEYSTALKTVANDSMYTLKSMTSKRGYIRQAIMEFVSNILSSQWQVILLKYHCQAPSLFS